MRKSSKSRSQRKMRAQRGESAFVFDASLSKCVGRVDREEWEQMVDLHGGSEMSTAIACGLEDVPRNAKALWGRTAEEALATYQKWRANKRR